VRADRAPVLGISPDLMIVKIAKQRVHDVRIICNVSGRRARKIRENALARALHQHAGMDPAEFDRLVARAQNPRLIPGIYNYCDGRCPRCPFTERCLTFLDTQQLKAAGDDEDATLADAIGASLQRTIEMLAEVARREGIDLSEVGAGTDAVDLEADFERHQRDPLVMRAHEYGQLAWRITKGIEAVVAARGDPMVVEAVETINWFSSMVGSKLYRAVSGLAEGWETDDQAQTDFNGSAKVALLGIDASRRSWRVLMDAGKATADGVPAQAVKMLDALDAAIRERFPRAMAFVRPGFDEPTIAAGAPAGDRG
jgi:hypothetical protein